MRTPWPDKQVSNLDSRKSLQGGEDFFSKKSWSGWWRGIKGTHQTAMVAGRNQKNMNATKPTLLEIACNFNHWSEYLDVDGHIDEHEFQETSSVTKLMQIQKCGFFESYRGDLYDSNGCLNGENVLVEIESSGATGDSWPTIVIGDTVHRTQDFREISSDTLTGPGGWYVIVRGTEGGEE